MIALDEIYVEKGMELGSGGITGGINFGNCGCM